MHGHDELRQRRLLPGDPDLAVPHAAAETAAPSSACAPGGARRRRRRRRGAWSKSSDLVLRADGGFTPRTLPRAPLRADRIQGPLRHQRQAAAAGRRRCSRRSSTSTATAASTPPACRPARRNRSPTSSTDEARAALPRRDRRHRHSRSADRPRRRRRPGQLAADDLQRPAPSDGNPTVVLHARTTVPATQTFAIVVPIERRAAALPLPRHRSTCRRSPAASARSPTSTSRSAAATAAGGKPRSYVSARCTDSILETHGRFTFADGTVIEGASKSTAAPA